MPPRDNVTGNGASNGARRSTRSRRAAHGEDDRPRGFEPDRMRRLWSDIDNARDNLGLGPETAAPSPEWSIGGLVGYAADLATGAAGTVASQIGGVVRGVVGVVPDPRRAIAAAAPCVRRLPIIGVLFE